MRYRDQALVVRIQESEVSRAAESLGQDVLEDEPQEVGAGDGSGVVLSGLGVAIAEGQVVVVVGEDVLLADDAATEVAAQIDEGGMGPKGSHCPR